MTLDISDKVAQRILDAVEESARLEKLSNEELVREYLKARGTEDDLIGEELCNRVWPEWEVAEL